MRNCLGHYNNVNVKAWRRRLCNAPRNLAQAPPKQRASHASRLAVQAVLETALVTGLVTFVPLLGTARVRFCGLVPVIPMHSSLQVVPCGRVRRRVAPVHRQSSTTPVVGAHNASQVYCQIVINAPPVWHCAAWPGVQLRCNNVPESQDVSRRRSVCTKTHPRGLVNRVCLKSVPTEWL